MFIAQLINIIFAVALFINALLFIPQAIKIFKLKTSNGVSLLTFLGFLIIQFAIICHGIIEGDIILIIGYVISMLTTGLVVALILFHKKKDSFISDGMMLEDIVQQFPGHVYWKDLHFIGRGANRNNWMDFGCTSLENFIGKTDYDLLPKEQADLVRKNDLEVINTGNSLTVEESLVHSNGKPVIYLSHKQPLKNEHGKIVGILGVSIDVTLSKQKILEELHMLNNIIAAMPGNVYWMDKNGCYLGCNDNQARLIGLSSRQAIIGKRNVDIPGFLIPDTLDPVNQEIMRNGIPISLEEPGILPDGTEATFMSNKVPLKNSFGEVVGLLGISVDITNLKKTQAELVSAKEQAEAANHAKTEFVQNMQHDIRTPSAGLWGVLDVLAKTEPDNDRQEALDMAVAASKRLLDLCNEAVEFGDLSGNAKPVVQKSLDIRALARSVIELNLPAAFAKDLIINFKVATSVPPHIASDEFRLSRILINLLGNAIKFSHQGEITLNMDASLDEDTRKGFLTIELKDTGIGIAADKVNTIFEKFTRGVASNTNKYPGTGLGLYVVKTFMDELNGDIYLESHENEGTYIKINIPFKALLEDMKKPGVKIEEQFKSTIKQNIEIKQSIKGTLQKKPLANRPFTHELLIIEDDKTCLFAEKNLLSAFTNHIDTAENVAEALEKLASKRYDLVISDLGLPDGSGNDIVGKIKATPESPNYETPFVAMTAHQDALKHQQAMAAGFTATNTKPLGSEKATELLNMYPAQEAVNSHQEAVIPSKTEGYPVIDLALGMQRIAVNSEESAIEALGILWETLQEDILLLQKAQENNDSEGVNALLLKIRGSLCYTGTPRLEAACEALYNEAKSGLKDLIKIHGLFSLFYDEAKLFAEQFKELIKGVNAQQEAEHLRMVNEKQKALLAQEEKFIKIANQVAHDIRSPLSSLLMIVKSCIHIPEADRIALREAAIGIGDITNHLLHQYKKKDTDEAVSHEERLAVLVATVLMESLTIKKYQYEGLPIHFDCNFAPNTQFAFIKIQASAFKRMLSNLMNNAVDAFEDKPGMVHLQLETDNEWVRISIQDTGKGMPPELIDKIMHKTAVTQGKKSGHGLGFTQVWETLDHNQGELHIDSKLGKGTTITITFPRVTAPHWIAEEIVLNPNDTVIILDDDSSIHGAWRARFEKLQGENSELKLKHFQLGNEALKFIETLTPAEKKNVFLLSDYELLKQELNGLEVIAQSKIQHSILVTSHYVDLEVQRGAARIGIKILPKQLASETIIKMNDADFVETAKVYAVIVDDNEAFVRALQFGGFGDENTEAYYNPEHFLNNVAKYPKDTRIFLDNNYNCSELTGLIIAKKLHELGYTRLYILSGEAYLEAPPYVTVIAKGRVTNFREL